MNETEAAATDLPVMRGNEVVVTNPSFQSLILRSGRAGIVLSGRITRGDAPKEMLVRGVFAGMDLHAVEIALHTEDGITWGDFAAFPMNAAKSIGRRLVDGAFIAYQRTSPGTLDTLASLRALGVRPVHASGGTSAFQVA